DQHADCRQPRHEPDELRPRDQFDLAPAQSLPRRGRVAAAAKRRRPGGVFRRELKEPPPGLPRLKAGVGLPSPEGGGMELDAATAKRLLPPLLPRASDRSSPAAAEPCVGCGGPTDPTPSYRR